MPRIDWNDQLDEDMHFATNMLLDHGSVAPMFVLHPRDDDMMVVGAGFRNDNEKLAVYTYIQWLCVANDVVAFSFIGEAWLRLLAPVADENTEDAYKRALSVRPSQAPDRKEIISAMLVYRDEAMGKKKVISRMVEIVRNADGKATGVIPMVMPPSETEGDLARILLDKRPSALVRADAAKLLESVPADLVRVMKRKPK